jgi:hypothetical protein
MTIPSFFQSRQLSLIAADPLYLSTRTFSRRLTANVSQYRHEIRAIGGYYSANISIADNPRRLEEWASYGLGRHITTYNPSLVKIWEGFINQINITEGSESFTIGPLIDIGNRQVVTYSPVNAGIEPPAVGARVTAATGNNTDSQALYGIWQKVTGANQVTSTEAGQLRDKLLADPTIVYPDTSLDSSFQSNNELSVELLCLGYWHFLTGYYYANTGVTGYESISTKIQNVLAANPNSIFSADYSMIATNATLVKKYEDGTRTAETILREVNSLGDSSFNAYTMGFYNDRQFVYQPMPTEVTYQRRATGNRGITNQVNREIMPWDIVPARWIFRPDFMVGRHPPITAATLGIDPRAAFIETVQFDAPYGLSVNGHKLSQIDQVFARKGLGASA